MNQKNNAIGLSGNTLKVIAAVLMVIDHIGYFLYPKYVILRVIGRLSFPIFAFMIAEGCYHTRNKWRYFSGIFGLAFAYQVFNFFFVRDLHMCILVTFSIAILFIYLLQFLKERLFFQRPFWRKILAVFLLLLAVEGIYLLNRASYIDYGFWGCMVPAFACIFKKPKNASDSRFEKLDRFWIHILMFGLGLFILSLASGWVQMYCLLALPLLMMYSGKRGKINMKWFFYVFYPVHIGVIYFVGALFYW